MQRTSTGSSGGRPMIMARHGVVSAGHYLAAEAGLAMLRRGGNAFDAAAAAGFALTVVLPDQNGLAGEAPMLVYSARRNATFAVSGHGVAPRTATVALFREMGIEVIPGDGLLPAVTPATVGSWIHVLSKFGTLRLADVLAPAIELARDGFAVSDALHNSIAAQAERFRRDWPSSADVFLTGKPGRQAPAIGEIWRNRDLARTLESLARADRRHRKRADGLRAAHDEFYRGAIARRIARFCRSASVPDAAGSHKGLLSEDDLAGFEPRLEEPVSVAYRAWRVFKCPTWCQGPAMLQTLALLEGYDLAAMTHNSAAYVHTVIEAMKLAFADREFYYGDPPLARVPIRRLLSKEYAAERRKLIDPAVASMELRPGGYAPLAAKDVCDIERAFLSGPNRGMGVPPVRHAGVSPAKDAAPSGPKGGDTTAVQVVDREGNIVSAVTSGGWLQSSPVVPGLGFPLGTRGQMFCLAEGHPDCLAPLKRPRTTLTPGLAGFSTRGRPPHLAFSSPGGDCQEQWGLQFFLNMAEFGMSLQEAVEAPTFWTKHFPSSFYPRTAEPGSLHLESRVAQAVIDGLAAKGHVVHKEGPWSGGNTITAAIDRKSGVLSGAASPRHNPAYATGW
ncbi:MAG: gamma-glutamyltransferase family protein [Phycisphaerae bacterium]